MSFDYPDYPRIREKSRLLGWLWMIGDRGYYLGLVGAVLALSGAVAVVAVGGIGGLVAPGDDRALRWWGLLPICLVSFPVFVAVFFAAVYVKAVARRRSGIPDDGYLRR